MHFIPQACWGLFVSLGIALLAGCESNTTGLTFVPAEGTVTLDGSPLTGADVEFVPQDIAPNAEGLGGSAGFGNTDDSGQFEMYTASNAGVQPGTYQVRISKIAEPEVSNPDAPIPEGKQVVPPEYNTKSNLMIDISEDGDTDLKFELHSP